MSEITLRNYLAAMAMNALIQKLDANEPYQKISYLAYEQADNMLLESNRNNNEKHS